MERLDMPAKNAVALIVSVVLFIVAVWFAAPSGSPGPDAPLSSSQKQEIESLIGRYLRENPTVIVEAIQNLQRRERQNRDRRAAQNLVRYRQQLINNPSTPFVGKTDAKFDPVLLHDTYVAHTVNFQPFLITLRNPDRHVLDQCPSQPVIGAYCPFV